LIESPYGYSKPGECCIRTFTVLYAIKLNRSEQSFSVVMTERVLPYIEGHTLERSFGTLC